MLPELDKELVRSRIAKRIALEFEDGDVVNLGIGIPTLVSDYIPEGVRILFQTENGAVAAGPKPEVEDLRLIGAGGRALSLIPGGSFVSSDVSFGLIRGGHLDATVLGALEVDAQGNLANWMIPGKMVPGMGGAMDLVTGAKRVIIATTHCNKKGNPKIVERCTLPLTGARVVSAVVTEFGVFRCLEEGFTLTEIAPEVTPEELQKHTGAAFRVDPACAVMKGLEEDAS